MRRISATIQARTGSTRLPGKVLKTICGVPILQLLVERLTQSILIDEIIIATSVNVLDDPIQELADKLKVSCFRGSEDDVLGRVTGAIKQFEIDIHVEFQGDNVMPDPMIIDSVIGYYLKNSHQFDYVTNGLKTTYPPGQEVSVYTGSVLLKAEKEWSDELSREHVGIHIYKRPELFKVKNLVAPSWLSYPSFHLEVDTEEDFAVSKKIYEHFLPHNPGFSLGEIISFVKKTGLCEKPRC